MRITRNRRRKALTGCRIKISSLLEEITRERKAHPLMEVLEKRPFNCVPAAAGKALIVAGPTCSGKSALALALAERIGGAVINADAMQSYRDLRILTARPSEKETVRALHFLYGVLDGAARGSVGGFLPRALEILEAVRQKNLVPIFCGGTGMYLSALLNGIAEIPPVPEEIRCAAEQLWDKDGGAEIYAALAQQDFPLAEKLNPNDRQRICRAWAVWKSSGKSLSYWQSQPRKQAAEGIFYHFHFAPSRTYLRSRLERRFEKMLEQGVVAEVEKFLSRGLPSDLPLMRAHGMPEFKRYFEGEISLEAAGFLAVSAMRAYAKRQDTWFRHHPLGQADKGMKFENPVTGAPQEDEISVEQAENQAVDFLEREGFFNA